MYGAASRADVYVTPLWWFSIPVSPDRKIEVPSEAPGDRGPSFDGPGVYCFEGKHDSRPEGGILYIGLANGVREDDESEPQFAGQSLRVRVNQSLGEKFQWADGPRKEQERGLFADVWDLTLRWARVDTSEPDHLVQIEALLIRAHAPSFNRQHVRGRYPIARPRLILNDGEKGRLLPAISSFYYDPKAPIW